MSSDGSVADEIVSGIPGTITQNYGVPFALTEEFVAVYRMHPLLPDTFDFRTAAGDAADDGRDGVRPADRTRRRRPAPRVPAG